MPEPGRWKQGETEIEDMLERGDLESVAPSADHAHLLMSQAQGHLDAAAPLVSVHPPSAFTLLYDGARKAMAAVLARQGLRATSAGGHIAIQDAIEAQLGPNVKAVIRPFRGLRRRRNESEYPQIEDPPVTEDEARAGLADATGIVERMRQFLPVVGPFR